MRRTRRIASLLCAGLLVGAFLVGCTDKDDAGDPTAPVPAAVVQVTVQDDGKVVTGAVGDTFSLKLEENPTTGYQWKATREPDSAIVKQASSEYLAPETDMVGAGGVREWTFDTVGSGETELEMEYARSFGTEDPDSTFSVTFKVEE